jgi:TolB protein
MIAIRKRWVSSLAPIFSPLLLALLPSPVLAASSTADIAVGEAKTKKTVIAFDDIELGSADLSPTARQIQETVTKNLQFVDLFRILDRAAFIEAPGAGLTLDRFKVSDWTSIGAEFVVKSKLVTESARGAIALEAYLHDTRGVKQLLGKRYLSTPTDPKAIAHALSNDVVTLLTGLPGIFQTRIAMSCDRTGKKEIYVMDFDGSNIKQVTQHRSISFAPAWHPNGNRVAYSVFTRRRDNVKNIDLYEVDFETNRIRLLSNKKGINSGASYSPDGRWIAATMSFLGNPEIFRLDPETGEVLRLTKSFGFDVDPSWSPDARQMAFVSSRSGMPMVYSMNLDGSAVKRLTYAGRYNATPSWSPTNNKIAFAGWIDGRFDIFVMNPDGTRIERLTKNQGNNEDPTFSPDGQLIAFSSNRTGQKNIYVMNLDGSFVRRLTFGLGNCVAPRWSASTRKTATSGG